MRTQTKTPAGLIAGGSQDGSSLNSQPIIHQATIQNGALFSERELVEMPASVHRAIQDLSADLHSGIPTTMPEILAWRGFDGRARLLVVRGGRS